MHLARCGLSVIVVVGGLVGASWVEAQTTEAKGKPVDFQQLLRMEPDIGTTNVRRTESKHWKRWLEPANR